MLDFWAHSDGSRGTDVEGLERTWAVFVDEERHGRSKRGGISVVRRRERIRSVGGVVEFGETRESDGNATR